MNTTTGIAYTFSIDEVTARYAVENFSNVVYKVSWVYSGINTLGVAASLGPSYVNFQFDPSNADGFVDSSSLTKSTIKGWLEQKLDHMIPIMQENIANQISAQGVPYKVVLDLPD